MAYKKPLIDLWPKYIDMEYRTGLGVSFHCPGEAHPHHFAAYGPHRIELWFLHPDDGGMPNDEQGKTFYHHLGDLFGLKYFSVYDVAGQPLHVEGHWTGYLVEGVVYDSSEEPPRLY